MIYTGRIPKPKNTSQRYRAETPDRVVSAYIRYQIALKGFTVSYVAEETGTAQGDVSNVISGRRHSRRVEAYLAKLLGYGSWNDAIRSIRVITADVA